MRWGGGYAGIATAATLVPGGRHWSWEGRRMNRPIPTKRSWKLAGGSALASLRRPLRFAAWRVATWARSTCGGGGPGPRPAGDRRSRLAQVGQRRQRCNVNIEHSPRCAATDSASVSGSAPKTRKTNPHSGSARHALTFGTKCRGHMSHVSFAGCITQLAPARRTAGGKGRASTANCLSVGYSLIFSQPPRNEARSLGATHLASTTASRH